MQTVINKYNNRLIRVLRFTDVTYLQQNFKDLKMLLISMGNAIPNRYRLKLFTVIQLFVRKMK